MSWLSCAGPSQTNATWLPSGESSATFIATIAGEGNGFKPIEHWLPDDETQPQASGKIIRGNYHQTGTHPNQPAPLPSWRQARINSSETACRKQISSDPAGQVLIIHMLEAPVRIFPQTLRVILSKSRGTSGVMLLTGFGSSFRIAESVEIFESPRNARRPVTIS